MIVFISVLIIKTRSLAVIKDVLFKAKELKVDAEYSILSDDTQPQMKQGSPYVLTLLTSKSHISAECFSDIFNTLKNAKVNILKVTNLSEEYDQSSVLEFTVEVPIETELIQLKEELVRVRKLHSVDIAVQAENLLRRQKRMVVMDMNYTLIQSDLLSELLAHINQDEKAKEIKEKYADAKQYELSLKERTALLKDLDVKVAQQIAANIPLSRGARLLCLALKKLGYKTVIISSGFDIAANRVKQELGIDYVYSNTLVVKGGKLTGEIEEPLINANRKVDILNLLAQKEGISLDQIIAIGDGPVSAPMIASVGLGIAFDSTPSVQNVLFSKDLSSIIYFLGYTKQWFEATLSGGLDNESGLSVVSENTAATSETEERDRTVIYIKGRDRPGVLHALCEVVAKSGAQILDLRQVVVHDRLILVMLLEELRSRNNQAIKELLFRAKTLGEIEMDFETLSTKMQNTTLQREKNTNQYAVTLMNGGMHFNVLRDVFAVIDKLGLIREINRLSDATTSDQNVDCFELIVELSKDVTTSQVKPIFMQVSKQHATDIALQSENVHRKTKRLVVMDMDSTLIQHECIDEMAKYAGVEEQVKEITRRAMNGELDFEQSLRQRVALLKGVSTDIYGHISNHIIYTEGAHFLCKALKKLGYKLAVISGGFVPIVQQVKQELGLDYAFANTLEAHEGKLTGRVIGSIIDAQKKADLLSVMAKDEGISTEQVIAVGDGANDLLMLMRAGLGIAFNAKPKVQEAAEFRVNQKTLSTVLYFLGISEKEANEFM